MSERGKEDGVKVDLEELERKAKAAGSISSVVPWWYADSAFLTEASVPPDDRALIAAASPNVVIALVARIRELERALTDLVDECALGSDEPDEYNSERAIIAKGVVLP